MAAIGRIERVPLREVWPHEALDFTTWLEEDIDVLNDVTGLSLSSAERERAAGSFSVDLLAQNEAGDLVVVENQLEKSNHDHLGKVLTYLTAFEAKAAVWIVSEPRPEHVDVITWLNQVTPASFYLVKVEAVKIGESLPAPLLTLIVGPSEESKEVGETKKELAEGQRTLQRFWTQMLDRLRDRATRHSNLSPSHQHWLEAGAGRSGLALSYVVRQHDARVELYIDRGKDSEDDNRAIFDALAAGKDAIEERFGGPLAWEALEGRRACRIQKTISVGGWRDEDKWPELHEAMIDAMVRLDAALKPHIDALEV